MLYDRAYFSLRQAADAVYYGRGVPHPQQLAYIRELLDGHTAAGHLIRNDQIAACPLYTFTPGWSSGPIHGIFTQAMIQWPSNWQPDSALALLSLNQDLARFVPKHPNPVDYPPDGKLQVPPATYTGYLKAYRIGNLP
jgi:hypothetical protein